MQQETRVYQHNTFLCSSWLNMHIFNNIILKKDHRCQVKLVVM